MEGRCIESAPTELMAVISDADAAARISDAVIAFLPRFHRIAVGRLGNIADAEDAVQNALLLAWKNIGQFKGQAHISTWISAILINSTRMAMRNSRRHRYASLDDQDPKGGAPAMSQMISDYRPGPEELCRRWELAERAIQLSRDLSPTLRKTFELRDVHGLSVEETAQVMGIKDSTVKTRTKRARAALRRGLERRHEGLEQM